MAKVLPYSWRCARGHEHPSRGVWMPHKKDEDKDDHNEWE